MPTHTHTLPPVCLCVCVFNVALAYHLTVLLTLRVWFGCCPVLPQVLALSSVPVFLVLPNSDWVVLRLCVSVGGWVSVNLPRGEKAGDGVVLFYISLYTVSK